MSKHGSFLASLAAPLAICTAPAVAANSAPVKQTEPPEAVATTAPVTPAQKQALARFIKVWGFVKYHHGDARAGRLAMDREFERMYPLIRNVENVFVADRLLAGWLAQIGIGPACNPCASELEAGEVAIASPTPEWIATLPEELAVPVSAIYENRIAAPANFQIETVRNVGNARFLNEPDYRASGRDDPALRMLTVARMWNTLRYWFPYRDIMDEDVDDVLASAIEGVLAAQGEDEFKRAIVRLAVAADDGHVRVLAYRDATKTEGDCLVPYTWRYVEGQLVVDGVQAHEAGLLKRGDIVRGLDGETIEQIEARSLPFVPGSNDASRKLGLSLRLQSGRCGPRTVTVERGGEVMDVVLDGLPSKDAGIDLSRGRDRDGDTIQQMEDGITYVRFPVLKRSELVGMMEQANAGEGLVLDMRGYVSDYFIYDLGGLLTDAPFEFARFTKPDPDTPGQFTWTDPVSVNPNATGMRITVPVVVIVDEMAGSSPEYHAMAWRGAGVTLVGSPTAGADGNVSTITLPLHGAEMRMSGIGVFYPDKTPTQRIGIVPDVEVMPTLAGIAAGRDEVLEEALRVVKAEAAKGG